VFYQLQIKGNKADYFIYQYSKLRKTCCRTPIVNIASFILWLSTSPPVCSLADPRNHDILHHEDVWPRALRLPPFPIPYHKTALHLRMYQNNILDQWHHAIVLSFPCGWVHHDIHLGWWTGLPIPCTLCIIPSSTFS
jgi:hypothetical protein